MGQAVSFEYSSHTPVDDVQMHEWEETHGWVEPHLWDFPMLPANMTEASCAKCHRGSVYVPDGPQLSLAYRALRAGRLLRMPHDARISRPAEAWSGPDQDRRQADSGMGQPLGPRASGGQAEYVDAPCLVQREYQRT